MIYQWGLYAERTLALRPQVVAMREQGMTLRAIGEKLGVHQTRVGRLLRLIERDARWGIVPRLDPNRKSGASVQREAHPD